MTASAAILAAAALLPAMTGPPPVPPEPAARVTVGLCNGGGMTVAYGGNPDRTPATVPCCAKGCHASGSRRRIAGT